MNKRKCKHCGKRDEKPMIDVGLSRVHDACMNKFIEATLVTQRKKKRIKKRDHKEKMKKMRKKYKETTTYWRKKAIVLACDIAKERDGRKCMYCGVTGDTAKIDASHVYSKGKYLYLAADPLNIKPLCANCHLHWWHSCPIPASEWFKKKFPDRLEYLNKKIKNHKQGRVDWEKKFKQLKEYND